MSSAKTQKASSMIAQYGPSMARSAPQALHRFKFVSSLSAGFGSLCFILSFTLAAGRHPPKWRRSAPPAAQAKYEPR